MLFINNTQIDLSLLMPSSPTGGRNYKGTDEVLGQIASKWQELHDRFGHNGQVTFIRPHMKSGYGPGSMGGAFDRSVQINTRTGTKTITWCDVAIEQAGGGHNFLPKKFTHTAEQSIVLFMDKDIEQILWHCLYDPLKKQKYTYPKTDPVGKPHPKGGKQVDRIYILDTEDDASAYIMTGAKSADMWFYLTRPTSPIIGKRDLINTLASAWGVFKPESMSDVIVRQSLIQAIQSAEEHNYVALGYDAFSKAVENVLSGDDTEYLETMALVNKANDRNIVKYYATKMAWFLMTETNVEIKKLCNVPASQTTKTKEVLVDHLMHNEDDMTIVQASVESKPIGQKEIKRFYIPNPPTREFFMSMKHPTQKSICHLLSIDHHGKTRTQLAEHLIEHFIIQGKSLPAENLLDEPTE